MTAAESVNRIDERELGRIVDAILGRMALPLTPQQQSEVRGFLVDRLWYEWPVTTLFKVRDEVLLP